MERTLAEVQAELEAVWATMDNLEAIKRCDSKMYERCEARLDELFDEREALGGGAPAGTIAIIE